MPLMPPCTSSVSPACRPRDVEHVLPDGEEGLRQARGLDVAQALGHRQALARPARRTARRSRRRPPARRRGRRRFRPAAARSSASPPAHRAGDFQPRQVGHARRHRVQALALQHVGPVDARRAARAISNSPAPGIGSGRWRGTSTSGPPGCVISMARMVDPVTSARLAACCAGGVAGSSADGAAASATAGAVSARRLAVARGRHDRRGHRGRGAARSP